MPRTTAKLRKTRYQIRREELGLSREKASELLGTIPPERIERIETGKYSAYPEEVLTMAEKYHEPLLCNFYCANDCAIGKQYVPEVKTRDLAQIVLEMLASLNSVKERQDRLIAITADGKVSADEVADFVSIQNQLEHISITVEALQLWAEKQIAYGEIDLDAYHTAVNQEN
jgi:hypothetical protein